MFEAPYRTYTRVNRTRPWYRLPFVFGLFNLIALRDELREYNLIRHAHAGRREDAPPASTLTDATDEQRRFRTPDGSLQRSERPRHGEGRHAVRAQRAARRGAARPRCRAHGAEPARDQPRLMRRESFTPATSINLLAASWIQFQTHDWFAHGREKDERIEHPASRRTTTGSSDPMRIPRTKPDTTRVDADDDLPAHLHQQPVALVGRVGDLRQLRRQAAEHGAQLRRRQARPEGRTSSARSRRRASRSRVSARTGGSGSGCCTRCSRSSTTRSATQLKQRVSGDDR